MTVNKVLDSLFPDETKGVFNITLKVTHLRLGCVHLVIGIVELDSFVIVVRKMNFKHGFDKLLSMSSKNTVS